MKSLMQLENWIEQLVEEPFVRFFAGPVLPQDVASHLVRALEDAEQIGKDGTPEVPGHYTIALNPKNLQELQENHPHLEQALGQALKSLVERMHIRMRKPPTITLREDPALPPREVSIRATAKHAQAEPTRDLDLSALEAIATEQDAAQHKAYFIVQGKRTFDLTYPLVRIGRALDNDLILEDHCVSRHHAQLRLRYNRYILQDLHSNSGIMVNGFPIQEIVLRPGDVISLAGVELVYVEETSDAAAVKGDTQPYNATEP